MLAELRSLCLLLLTGYEEYIPSPPTELRVVHIPDLRTVAELIPVLVCPLRLSIIEINRFQSEVTKSVQLFSLRDAVVIRILPQT